MTLTRKDAAATALTVLVVLIFAAAHESWGVPLFGDSHRAAIVAIAVLGVLTCALGSPGEDRATKLLSGLGAIALVLTLVALSFNSLTVLALLVADIVVMWVASTLRHVHVLHAPGRPLTR
jgi:hypothetical protein